MLGKFKDQGWFEPLAFHAGVHAVGTLLLAALWGAHHIILLALFDFVLHFTMDRIKASPNLLGRFKALSGSEFPQVKADSLLVGQWVGPEDEVRDYMRGTAARKKLRSNRLFWWFLGLDQMVHHLTHYAILLLMILGA
jgi:hypothetical protein